MITFSKGNLSYPPTHTLINPFRLPYILSKIKIIHLSLVIISSSSWLVEQKNVSVCHFKGEWNRKRIHVTCEVEFLVHVSKIKVVMLLLYEKQQSGRYNTGKNINIHKGKVIWCDMTEMRLDSNYIKKNITVFSKI